MPARTCTVITQPAVPAEADPCVPLVLLVMDSKSHQSLHTVGTKGTPCELSATKSSMASHDRIAPTEQKVPMKHTDQPTSMSTKRKRNLNELTKIEAGVLVQNWPRKLSNGRVLSYRELVHRWWYWSLIAMRVVARCAACQTAVSYFFGCLQ